MASWILAAYLVGSLFCSFDQLFPSDDTLDPSVPQHYRAPTRHPPFSATSAFTKHPRRFHPTPSRFSPAHGGATRCGFHPRYPLRLRTTPSPYRRPPHLPSPTVSFSGCPFLLLQSLITSFFGWLLRPVGLVDGGGRGGGGGILLFLLLLITCSRSTSQPLLGCVILLSATFPSPPSCPLHCRYPPLHRVSRNDKHWLCRRHHIQAYRKFANAHHLRDITTNMTSLTTAEALRAILQAPTKLRDTMPKDGSFSIILDSGASISVTNDKDNFFSFTKVSPRHNNVMGVALGLKFSGFGEVLWGFLDEKGTLRSFKLPALYIPSATTRLLSTTSLLQSYSGELIEQTGRGMCLSGTSDGQRNAVEATINPNNNLPTSTGYSYGKVMEVANTLVNTVSTTDATNTNLGPADKELLRWHNRLGHICMRNVQFLMRTIPYTPPTAS